VTAITNDHRPQVLWWLAVASKCYEDDLSSHNLSCTSWSLRSAAPRRHCLQVTLWMFWTGSGPASFLQEFCMSLDSSPCESSCWSSCSHGMSHAPGPLPP